MDEYRRHRGKARTIGLPFEVVGLDEIRRLHPLVDTRGLLGAAWNPDDGHVDPTSVTRALVRGAQDRGARLHRHTRVTAMERTPSGLSLVVAVAIVRWAEVARLVRAEVLRASSEGYVLAARALGASPFRIFYAHILRNAAGPILTSAVFGVAAVVLLEAAISFLAVGAPTPDASWGETLAQGAALWMQPASQRAAGPASALRDLPHTSL